ncbi:MAG TPA: hypothetical protein VF786_10745 [Terriglobales bacterium]
MTRAGTSVYGGVLYCPVAVNCTGPVEVTLAGLMLSDTISCLDELEPQEQVRSTRVAAMITTDNLRCFIAPPGHQPAQQL